MWKGHALTVVLAAAGYPLAPRKGDVIHGDLGLRDAELGDAGLGSQDALVFHAGTKRSGEELQTNGGRVLAVTAAGASIEEAAERAYACVGSIRFDGMQWRRDIGWQARRV